MHHGTEKHIELVSYIVLFCCYNNHKWLCLYLHHPLHSLYSRGRNQHFVCYSVSQAYWKGYQRWCLFDILVKGNFPLYQKENGTFQIITALMVKLNIIKYYIQYIVEFWILQNI